MTNRSLLIIELLCIVGLVFGSKRVSQGNILNFSGFEKLFSGSKHKKHTKQSLRKTSFEIKPSVARPQVALNSVPDCGNGRYTEFSATVSPNFSGGDEFFALRQSENATDVAYVGCSPCTEVLDGLISIVDSSEIVVHDLSTYCHLDSYYSEAPTESPSAAPTLAPSNAPTFTPKLVYKFTARFDTYGDFGEHDMMTDVYNNLPYLSFVSIAEEGTYYCPQVTTFLEGSDTYTAYMAFSASAAEAWNTYLQTFHTRMITQRWTVASSGDYDPTITMGACRYRYGAYKKKTITLSDGFYDTNAIVATQLCGNAYLGLKFNGTRTPASGWETYDSKCINSDITFYSFGGECSGWSTTSKQLSYGSDMYLTCDSRTKAPTQRPTMAPTTCELHCDVVAELNRIGSSQLAAQFTRRLNTTEDFEVNLHDIIIITYGIVCTVILAFILKKYSLITHIKG